MTHSKHPSHNAVTEPMKKELTTLEPPKHNCLWNTTGLQQWSQPWAGTSKTQGQETFPLCSCQDLSQRQNQLSSASTDPPGQEEVYFRVTKSSLPCVLSHKNGCLFLQPVMPFLATRSLLHFSCLHILYLKKLFIV